MKIRTRAFAALWLVAILVAGTIGFILYALNVAAPQMDAERQRISEVLQVHDSLSWTGTDNPDINNEALRIMQSFGENDIIHIGLPLRVDASRGANWSEATFGA